MAAMTLEFVDGTGDEGDGDPTFLKQFHSIDFYVGRAI